MPAVRLPLGEDVLAKWYKSLCGGKAQVALAVDAPRGQTKQVFIASQCRVVVVAPRRVGGPRCDVFRIQEERPDLTTAGRGIGAQCGVSWGFGVGSAGLVATSCRVGGVRLVHIGFIEGHDDKGVAVLVGGGAEDQGHPGLEELVGPGEPTEVAP